VAGFPATRLGLEVSIGSVVTGVDAQIEPNMTYSEIDLDEPAEPPRDSYRS
jgi:hypothetical protein